jgi:hypothetical protein
MRESQFCRSSEKLRGHENTFREFMHILALVAQFGKFCENDTTDQNLTVTKGISKEFTVRMVRMVEVRAPLLNDIKGREYCINTVVPLDCGFFQVSISVVDISNLMQGLD